VWFLPGCPRLTMVAFPLLPLTDWQTSYRQIGTGHKSYFFVAICVWSPLAPNSFLRGTCFVSEEEAPSPHSSIWTETIIRYLEEWQGAVKPCMFCTSSSVIPKRATLLYPRLRCQNACTLTILTQPLPKPPHCSLKPLLTHLASPCYQNPPQCPQPWHVQ